MPFILEYSIKFSISLAMVYLFYATILRRLTFYHWNRWYLLVYSSMAFLIALIDISPFVYKNQLETSQVIQIIPLFDSYKESNKSLTIDNWGFWDWTLLLFVAGAVIMILRMGIQYFSINRIRSKAKLLLDAPVKVYQVDASIIPFSFGKSIFINQALHSDEELKEIIRHEFIHIRQLHTVDMIWGEILCIFNWYNPFAWLVRKSIRQNLEFIADDKVLKNGIDRKQYQYLLLKVIGVSQFSIANQFNFSSLKKRIAMMNKMRSARVHLVKFMFVIPLVLVLLLAFRSQQQNDTIPDTVDLSIDTIPSKYKALPKEFEDIHVTSKSTIKVINGKDILVMEPETVIITLKNGKKETYGFNNPADLEAFEKKYKRPLDSILPPPPPSPPGPPNQVPPGSPNDKSIPPPPPPPAPPVKDLPEAINDVDVQEFTVTIKRKDGKVETYDLKVKGDLSKFEEKYGRRLEDMVPCEPIFDAPNGKPNLPAPTKFNATPPKGPAPAKSGIPPATDLPASPDLSPPTKESTPTNKPAPVKPGVKPKPGVPAPSKPGAAPITTLNGDLNEIKIDASLERPGIHLNRTAKVSIRNLKDTTIQPLIIIDGKESSSQNINELMLDPESIESISVLKDASAIKAYGERGKNGVIIIETKKSKIITQNESEYRQTLTITSAGLQWELIKSRKGKKVYMVDKKFLTSDDNQFESWISKNKIYVIEVSTNEKDLAKFGLDKHSAIANAVTFANRNNMQSFMVPPKIIDTTGLTQRMQEEAKRLNCLFVGIKNPIELKVEDVDMKDIVVKLNGYESGVTIENGIINLIPRPDQAGTNVKIDIYKRDPNKGLVLLNSRYFRVQRLPPPSNFFLT